MKLARTVWQPLHLNHAAVSAACATFPAAVIGRLSTLLMLLLLQVLHWLQATSSSMEAAAHHERANVSTR
jgi:hypothetical protein